MLKAEFFEIVANGENSSVEFKRDDIRPEQLAKEIVAFANVQGGRIFLGVEDTSLSTLDKSRLAYYLQDIVKDPEIPQTDGEWIERLLGLGLMADDGMGNRICSIAGLLCFGIKPRRFLRQAGLRVMAFQGDDKEYQALIDVVLDAPLFGRWQSSGSGQKELIDEGLIEKFLFYDRALYHSGGIGD